MWQCHANHCRLWPAFNYYCIPITFTLHSVHTWRVHGLRRMSTFYPWCSGVWKFVMWNDHGTLRNFILPKKSNWLATEQFGGVFQRRIKIFILEEWIKIKFWDTWNEFPQGNRLLAVPMWTIKIDRWIVYLTSTERWLTMLIDKSHWLWIIKHFKGLSQKKCSNLTYVFFASFTLKCCDSF